MLKKNPNRIKSVLSKLKLIILTISFISTGFLISCDVFHYCFVENPNVKIHGKVDPVAKKVISLDINIVNSTKNNIMLDYIETTFHFAGKDDVHKTAENVLLGTLQEENVSVKSSESFKSFVEGREIEVTVRVYSDGKVLNWEQCKMKVYAKKVELIGKRFGPKLLQF